jgi:N6-adenosine-specific RNA methylase IME4
MLFLWSTWPNLKDAYCVGESWGFTYKTLGFLWVKITYSGKLHTGLGYYTRSNSEPCLLFTRGNVNRTWIKSRGVHQIIMDDQRQDSLPGFGETVLAEIQGHSTKPQVFYERIETLVDGPYLELFGRRKQSGWTVLGNAVTGNDIRDDLLVGEGL